MAPRTSAARLLGAAIVAIPTVALATPQFFAAGGGMGVYYEAFLLDAKPAGLANHYFAQVIIADNLGAEDRKTEVVNCNESMPQVLREGDEQSIQLDLTSDPPSYMHADQSLWWAVCRSQFDVYGYEVERGSRILPSAEGSRRLMADLVEVVDGGEPALIYCRTPTVFWSETDQLIELIEGFDDRYPKAITAKSYAIFKATCRT